MHLKLLFSLLSLLLLTDPGGSGDGDGNDDGDGDTPSDGDDDGDDLSAIKTALDKERKAGREASKRAKSLEKELNDLKTTGQSEEEKARTAQKALEDRAVAAEQKLHDANARNAVTEAATKANAVSINAVYALVRSDIEFDDDGEPTNIPDLIGAARKNEPALFRAAGGGLDGNKSGNGNEREISPGLDRLTAGYEQLSKAKR